MKDLTKEFSSRSQNQKKERKVESDNPTTKNKDSLNNVRPAGHMRPEKPLNVARKLHF